MVTKRTEDEIITQAAISAVLGGKKYEIKPLVIRDSRIWRGKVVAVLSYLPQYAATTTDNPELFGEAINQMLAVMPDKVIDLFFAYAKDLNRDEIEAVATDSEIAAAFGQVVDIGFPLAKSLVGTMTRISQ